MNRMRLINGDCLKEMDKLITEGVKVDAIITDPPYGTTACKWDSIIPFDTMWERLNKLIKPNGAIVLFGSEPFSSALRMSNIKNYRYDWIWEKPQGANFMTVKEQPYRVHEIISVFYKTYSDLYDTTNMFTNLKDYMINEKEKANLNNKQIQKTLGSFMGSHYFTRGSQFIIPNEESYKKLQTTGYFKKPFEAVKREYKKEKEDTLKETNIYNPQMINGVPYLSGKGKSGEITNNVTKIQTVNNGTRYPRSVLKFKQNKSKSQHPTQKPVALMEYLIKTYTNENETVLDFTMGSGSTGVACKNTDRHFIGIELDTDYFNIAKERINSTKQSLFLQEH